MVTRSIKLNTLTSSSPYSDNTEGHCQLGSPDLNILKGASPDQLETADAGGHNDEQMVKLQSNSFNRMYVNLMHLNVLVNYN